MALEIVEERIHLDSVFRSYNQVKKAPTSFVNIDELKTEMSKIVPILNFPTPAKRKQFRNFLGWVNWQAWFIKNIAEIKAPSDHLLKKNVPWSWEGGDSRKTAISYAFC